MSHTPAFPDGFPSAPGLGPGRPWNGAASRKPGPCAWQPREGALWRGGWIHTHSGRSGPGPRNRTYRDGTGAFRIVTVAKSSGSDGQLEAKKNKIPHVNQSARKYRPSRAIKPSALAVVVRAGRSLPLQEFLSPCPLPAAAGAHTAGCPVPAAGSSGRMSGLSQGNIPLARTDAAPPSESVLTEG